MADLIMLKGKETNLPLNKNSDSIYITSDTAKGFLGNMKLWITPQEFSLTTVNDTTSYTSMDDITLCGMYFIQYNANITNKPYSNSFNLLVTSDSDGNEVTQFAINSEEFKIRKKHWGTSSFIWTEWKVVTIDQVERVNGDTNYTSYDELRGNKTYNMVYLAPNNLTNSPFNTSHLMFVMSDNDNNQCVQIAVAETDFKFRSRVYENGGYVWREWTTLTTLNYSTDELYTGELYIDGKKVYRKTIEYATALPSTSGGSAYIWINSGIDRLVETPSIIALDTTTSPNRQYILGTAMADIFLGGDGINLIAKQNLSKFTKTTITVKYTKV
jgi:hypothetical protein